MIATKLHRRALTLALAVLGACTGGEDAENTGEGESVAEATREASSNAARFEREIRERGCEILTPELVSRTFDVAAEKLRAIELMGCTYTFKDETREVEASLTMLTAHRSEADAARRFANATASKTAEEVAADRDALAARMEESDRLKTESQKETAKSLLAMLPQEAVTFDDVPGVGDEAKISRDGTVYVRVDNLTFQTRAYAGERAPAPELTGRLTPEKILEAAKASSAAWAEKTAPKRERDGIALAKAVVAAL